MRFLLFVAALLISLPLAQAEEIQIFDMRKSLALSDKEPVFRDYYLSRGMESGLRPGMIVTVKRRQPLYDTIHNRSAGDLNLAVARIRIIHVEKGLAVARQHSEFGRQDLPLLEDNFIMIGDEVDLSSATSEGKGKAPRKEANQEAKSVDSDEKPPQTTADAQLSVDFVSQAPDNSAVQAVDGPTVQ